MPNNTTNTWEFKGSKEKITELKKQLLSKDTKGETTFSYSAVLPRPKELDGTISPTRIVTEKEHIEQKKKYLEDIANNEYVIIGYGLTRELADEFMRKFGATNWYDWSTQNWGTKWDAYEFNIKEDKETEGEAILRFEFQSAWSAPFQLIDKLALEQLPEDITFSAGYINEGYEAFGLAVYKNGEVVSKENLYYPDKNSPEEVYNYYNRIIEFTEESIEDIFYYLIEYPEDYTEEELKESHYHIYKSYKDSL